MKTIFDQISGSLQEGVKLRIDMLEHCGVSIAHAGNSICDCLRRGNKVLLFGNGGSAADAQHIAAEFVGRFMRERIPLPAVALTADTSVLTAIGNDYGFEQIFARQVVSLGKPGDVGIAISTSGNSPNVLVAIEACRGRGIKTIGLTGGEGGRVAKVVDIPIVVPSTNTARIQECHIAIGHIFCELVEPLFGAQAEDRDGKTPNAKLLNWETLLALRQQWQREGKTVVWTNGCFDLLHVGHLRSLQSARHLGEVLVIGLNSDSSVRQIKGPQRPIMPAHERAEILAALACVDWIIIFDETTPEVALSKLQPDIHTKGADYAPPSGKPVPEALIVESYGGRIEFLPMTPSVSTSDIVQRIRQQDARKVERSNE
jgi:phosphoheptose isomerase